MYQNEFKQALEKIGGNSDQLGSNIMPLTQEYLVHQCKD